MALKGSDSSTSFTKEELGYLAKPDYSPDIRIVPEAFEIDDKAGMISKIIIHGKGDNQKITLKPICFTVVLPIAKIVNVDTGKTSYEMFFDNKTVTVSGADLSGKKCIQQLADSGALVNEKDVKDLSSFWMEWIKLNQLPVKHVYDSMGWKETGYVLGNLHITVNGTESCKVGSTNSITHGIGSAGTIEGWINAVSLLMEYDKQRFKAYVVATAPLLKILHAQSFSIVDYGNTSIGKTITSAVCASMFGNPDALMLGGNTTKVGVEELAGLCTDMPLFLDDIQNMRKDAREFTVYQLANGAGKIRGTKEGGVRDVKHWRTIGMFTSETPILDEDTHAGAGMRLIEVSGGLGADDAKSSLAVNHFKTNIHDNYGNFAPFLIKHIIENKPRIQALNKKHFETLQNLKQKYIFDEQISGMAGRLAGIFASIMAAGIIFEEVYSNAGGERKDPEKILIPRFEEQLKLKSTEGYCERGLNHIRGWVAGNRDNFLTHGARDDERKGKVYGNVESDFIDIIPGELRKELEGAGFSTARLIGDFKENGLLIKGSGGQKNTITARIDGTALRVYRFKRSQFESLGMDI